MQILKARMLVPEVAEDHWKQNPQKYQHGACSWGCEIVCVDDKFSKQMKILFTILLRTWWKKVSTVVKWWKNILTKKLVMTKEDDEGFANLFNCWIYDNAYVEYNVKVRNHCYITWKYISSAHRDCNIYLK